MRFIFYIQMINGYEHNITEANFRNLADAKYEVRSVFKNVFLKELQNPDNYDLAPDDYSFVMIDETGQTAYEWNDQTDKWHTLSLNVPMRLKYLNTKLARKEQVYKRKFK